MDVSLWARHPCRVFFRRLECFAQEARAWELHVRPHSKTRNPQPATRNPKACNPGFETRNPKLPLVNAKRETRGRTHAIDGLIRPTSRHHFPLNLQIETFNSEPYTARTLSPTAAASITFKRAFTTSFTSRPEAASGRLGALLDSETQNSEIHHHYLDRVQAVHGFV